MAMYITVERKGEREADKGKKKKKEYNLNT
jgi:hypothetical protein